MSKNILIIEDNTTIRDSMVYSLAKEGYEVSAYDTAEHGLEKLKKQTFDLILLDLMLPGMSGETFLKTFANVEQIPVLVISALNDEFTQINMYNHKIDEFIVKPFSMNILLLKIEAVIRRSKPQVQQKETLVYRDITIEVGNYITYQNGVMVELTAKEFEVLQAMLLNQGKVFSREEFLTALWGYDYFVDSRTIDVHIKNIRLKLGKSLIETVKGVGYRIAK